MKACLKLHTAGVCDPKHHHLCCLTTLYWYLV